MLESENSSKRLRSNSSTKPHGQSSTNDMSVTELANLMKSQMETYRRSTKEDIKQLGESLSSQMNELKADIGADLVKLREETNKTIVELAVTIDQIKTNSTHALEKVTRSNDLIISGVPYVQGENLLNFFHTWCHNFGYNQNNFPLVDIRRLGKGAPVAGNVYMILIQFAFVAQRNDFYSKYLRTRNLMLSDIGFSITKRIYVNENLGPTARELRSKALRMKKDGKFNSVFTRDGIVYVKKNISDPGTAVITLEQLDSLIQS